MALTYLLDRCIFTTVTTGLSDFVIGPHVNGYLTPAEAGAVDGRPYDYTAESADKTEWECGEATYDLGAGLWRRTTIDRSSNGGTKVSFSVAPTVMCDALVRNFSLATMPGSAQEILTAARTYYVRADGNDNNTGLVDSAGGAFRLVQKAIDIVAALNINAQTVTIQIRDGSGFGAGVLKNVVGFATAGNLVIHGNSVTPANVVTDAFSADGLNVTWDIKNLKITATFSAVASSNGATVRVSNLVLDSPSILLSAQDLGKIIITGNLQITTGAHVEFIRAQTLAMVRTTGGITVTLIGTPNFTNYTVNATRGGVILGANFTFVGAATGARFNADVGGIIDTVGGGANYFPGNSAGTLATGGIYN